MKGRPSACILSSLALTLLCLVTGFQTAQSQASGDLSITIKDYYFAYSDSYIEVEIELKNAVPGFELGGFDLLIDYDTTILSFLEAFPGPMFNDCDWEYFEYRDGSELPEANLIRVVGVADINNGPQYPSCYFDDSEGIIALLSFYVTDVDSFLCDWFPVQFYWSDCSDNVVSDRDGDSMFVSDNVYDWLFHNPIHEDDEFPTYKGAPDECVTGSVRRAFDFTSAAVNSYCPVSNAGDLNLNGIPCEIADYLLYIQYFFYGIGVFDINVEAQIAASDVNADGLTLTFMDLIYLYRVIIGDVPPIPEPDKGTTKETATFVQDTIWNTISVEYSDSLGWAFLHFSDDVTLELVGGDMSLYPEEGTSGSASLVYPFTGEKTQFGEGVLLTYTGDGLLATVSAYSYLEPVPAEILITGSFLCGDADASGIVDIDDAVYIIAFIFTGGPEPQPYLAGSVDCNDAVDIDDVVHLIYFIFGGSPLPCFDCP